MIKKQALLAIAFCASCMAREPITGYTSPGYTNNIQSYDLVVVEIDKEKNEYVMAFPTFVDKPVEFIKDGRKYEIHPETKLDPLSPRYTVKGNEKLKNSDIKVGDRLIFKAKTVLEAVE